MPCDSSSGMGSGISYGELMKEVRPLKEEIDLITRFLCTLTKDLSLDHMDPELKEWVKKHREYDKKKGR